MDIVKESISQAGIEDIPNELLIDIIEDCVTWHGSHVSYIVIGDLLPLTLISKRWKYVIEATPTFWADIWLDGDEEDLLMKIFLGIHFSKAAPITLHFHRKLPPWTIVEHLIMGIKSRIYTVIIEASYNTDTVQMYTSQVAEVLEHLSPLPVLRRIIYNRRRHQIPGIDRIVQQNPSIVDVIVILLDHSTLTHDRRPWRRFFTEERLEIISTQVLNVDDLEEVHTVDMRTSLLESGPVAVRTGLRLSAISGAYIPGCLLLLRSISPNLVHLEIITTVEHLHQALPVLARLIALQTLKVDVDNTSSFATPPTKSLIFPKQYKPSRDLKEFTFTYYTSVSNASYLETMSSLWMEFRDTMPTVINLDLDVGTLGQVAFIVDTGFPYIESLKAETFRGTRSSDLALLRDAWKLPTSLKKVELICQLEGSSELGSANAETLSIEVDSPHDRTTSQIIDVSKWPALLRLSLEDLRLLLTDQSLHHLSQIKITEIYDKAVATDLCWKLATNPDHCPALKHITLSGYPELDILFIMIERRNGLRHRGTSWLEHLDIYLPCHSLHGPIIALLKGETTSRPSNFDLSWEGNAEILYDYSIPGCIHCHQNLIFCDTPATSDEKQTHTLSAPYPEDPIGILTTWPERRRSWNQLMNGDRA